VPKLDVGGGRTGVVAAPDAPVDPAALDEAEEDSAEVDAGPIENVEVRAKTSEILPILTAAMVYPDPSGTTGNVKLMVPGACSTLFAMAKESWNASLNSSSEKVEGSPASLCQVMVAGPPEVRPVGVSRVNAEINGAKARRHSLAHILF
jgi:hypothetical protein